MQYNHYIYLWSTDVSETQTEDQEQRPTAHLICVCEQEHSSEKDYAWWRSLFLSLNSIFNELVQDMLYKSLY